MPRITKMAPMAPVGEGNTILSPPRITAAKLWCFTYHRGDGSMAPVELGLKLGAFGEYGFGEELCPTTGNPHYQGWVNFTKKCRPIETVKVKEISWRKAGGTKEQNIEYCCKDGLYHTNVKAPWRPKDDLEGVSLYKWQQDVVDIVSGEVDKRKVYWFWEPKGNKGKSALAKHLVLTKKALWCPGGKGSDIAFTIAAVPPEEIRCVLFDLPRSSEGYVSFNIIEQLKNGLMMSPKYESVVKVFDPPHIIIFANFEPSMTDRDNLSEDRWVIRRI